MLNLFGMSYLHEILDGYQRVHPLRAGMAGPHHHLAALSIAGHCVFFGGGYVSEIPLDVPLIVEITPC